MNKYLKKKIKKNSDFFFDFFKIMKWRGIHKIEA